MIFFILSLVFFLLVAFLSLICRQEKWKRLWSCDGVVAASLIGLIPAISVLSGRVPFEFSLESPVSGLTIRIGLDSLSSFFLVLILGFSILAAFYAKGYLQGKKRLLESVSFFPILVASMVCVVTARDGFSFLIVWEIMSLSSFFLVTAEHEEREVRNAGWIYLAATHLANAFLLLLFTLLFRETGSFAFDGFSLLSSGPLAGFLFVCAVIGFGTKAGIFPFHLWLPHAHPAAPSYISALMSGVMIKTGIYGILRILTFLKTPPLWWGELLMILGIASAVLGVLYALTQHDLKKLLAYHSVENIGIIVTGIGLGLVGRYQHNSMIEFLGFAGALFHTVNHAIFKGLLFLGAGNILHAAHTRRIDQLGGLIKTMPLTGVTFLVASMAICGLPPLNGFMSEWFLYVGLLEGIKTLAHFPLFLSVSAIVGIAFAGGLAVVCFTKVFGVSFLGNPRIQLEQPPKDAGWQQLVPMGVLALLSLILGILPQLISPVLESAVEDLVLHSSSLVTQNFFLNLKMIGLSFGIIFGFFLLLLMIRHWLFSLKTRRTGLTWDCGLDHPTPRMQYTGASFTEPVRTFFYPLLRPILHLKKPEGLFPTESHFEEHVEDLSERVLFRPLFLKVASGVLRLRRMQRNRAQDYLAYIFATLILLFLWEVWFGN